MNRTVAKNRFVQKKKNKPKKETKPKVVKEEKIENGEPRILKPVVEEVTIETKDGSVN